MASGSLLVGVQSRIEGARFWVRRACSWPVKKTSKAWSAKHAPPLHGSTLPEEVKPVAEMIYRLQSLMQVNATFREVSPHNKIVASY
jgi:hypothetical protein